MTDLVFIPGDVWMMRGGKTARINSIMETGHIAASWDQLASVFLPTGRYWFQDEESEFDLMERVAEKSE